jgi:hypothetical protein
MWQSPRADGFVELEQDFARLLKNVGGKKWLCKTVTPDDGNLWGALKKEMPKFFSSSELVNFISSDQGGVRIFDFPHDVSESEIIGNLQLKRKEYFNSREELLFKVRLGQPRADKNREVTVSYLTKSLYEQIESCCRETGLQLGKVSTAIDTLLGAFNRQLQRSVADVCVILQVGYSYVNLLAVKGAEIVTARSLLTGSVRELENLLFSGFSLPKSDVWQMLNGSKPVAVQAIEDTIRTNRLELMTHIGSMFAELRSRKLLTDKSVFYICSSFTEEPQLGMMISERFGISVETLSGLQGNETVESAQDAKGVWLAGSSLPTAANLVPPVSRTAIHLAIPARLAVVAALVLAAAPLPFLNIIKMRSEKELQVWKERHLPIEALENDFKTAAAEQDRLVTLAKEITADIDRRGLATRLTRHLTEKLPPYSRLENLEISLKDNKLSLTGYTVDTETALRYLDTVKSFVELDEPEITVGDLESRRIRFDISAPIGKKG